ncbi:hypothetical protein [Salibacterium halotolerans]|uniref:Uncharacterized protein n=1 Tax=Salibacterium halotolerans TaxID=1884432 RepID=A0A1I5UV70_9BACI|nr:hypothetical protein [Salibacterium halotolerans]SFP99133.1 hypothetical protein SAMN05518683_11469 [Salibacterium halotolerans]
MLKNKTLEDAKQHLMTAHEIKAGNMGFLAQLYKDGKQQIDQINGNTKLSEEGKQEEKKEFQAEFALHAFRQMHNRKEQHNVEVQKANRIARELAYQKPKKPRGYEVERFEQDYKRLKTEIMLEPNSNRAKEKLEKFIDTYDDPYYRSVFQEDFAELTSSILSDAGQDTSKLKTELYKKFQDIEPSEVKEARQLYEETNERMGEENFFLNPLMEKDSTLSQKAKFRPIMGDDNVQFIDRTSEIFEAMPDEAPKPYVDEELDAQKRADERAEQERVRQAGADAIMRKGAGV